MLGRAGLLLLTACGRVAFEPRSDAQADSAPDGAVPADLLIYIPFENGVLANEGVGPDAACVNCPLVGPGHRVGTLGGQFGAAECLYIAAPTFQPAELTFAAWIRRVDATGGTVFGLPFDGATGSLNTFELWVNGNTQDVVLEVSQLASVSQPAPGAGVWRHYAGVYTGTSLTAYVDGVAVGTDNGTPPMYAGDPFRIGCDLDVGSERGNWTGFIDEVRLYSRALAPAEVAALAQ